MKVIHKDQRVHTRSHTNTHTFTTKPNLKSTKSLNGSIKNNMLNLKYKYYTNKA